MRCPAPLSGGQVNGRGEQSGNVCRIRGRGAAQLSGLMFRLADALQRPEPDGASGKERR
ncbi:hypothetical protein A6764_04065 [Brevibacillus sp. WF146]|uniref:hypothetical protein n=1 Tax=Brevibacillus sp. WF146 TaxID=319501 RepID=UPI000A761E17|nr:hypothetical protein [Brevibacillus sp. WF146]UYZ14151.1 hypothetical protein A6764_04065 [Brevibacillus sp. WF146]